MVKIDSFYAKSLAELADDHYYILNGKVKSGKAKGQWKKNSLVAKLTEAIANHQSEEKTFFVYLLDAPNHDRLKNIIIGSPQLLKLIIDDIGQKFPNLTFRKKNANDKWVFNDLGTAVHNIFNYGNYRKSSACTDYLAELGLTQQMPCPYCNHDGMSLVPINATTTRAEYVRALLDLDHFFPKSKYPYLAVSIFNLVPSCHNCNSRFKADKEFDLSTHIHPYVLSFNEEFKFELEKPYLPGQSANELNFKYTSINNFPDNSIKDFAIIERYDTRKETILEMLMQLYKKPLTNLNQVADLLPMPPERVTLLKYGGIPTTEQEIRKYSLGKLKRDICIEMKIY